MDLTYAVRDVMTPAPCTLDRSATVTEAAHLMRDRHIGGIVVADDDGNILGFITDRDLVVRCLALGKPPETTSIDTICSRELTSVGPDQSIDHAIGAMVSSAVRRLPVVENGRAVGVISLGDLALTSEQPTALSGISAARPNL